MSLNRKQRRANERARQENINPQQAPLVVPPVSAAPPVRTGPTGPRTPEGKAISSRNALSHGLTSAKLVLPGENEADFKSLLSGLVEEHQPATATEQILVREMAEQYWRLQRARSEEHHLLANPDRIMERTRGDLADARREWYRLLGVAQRYCTRYERGFHRALSVLRKMQNERATREAELKKAEEERQVATAPVIRCSQPHQPAVSVSSEFVLQNPMRTPECDGEEQFLLAELVSECA